MIIYFGLHFDGLHSNPIPSSLGEKWVGPSGMLSVLQTQLGVAPPDVSHTKRVIEYLKLLQEHDHPECFYHRSLMVDEFNVAEELLSWRERWYSAGWDGTFAEGVPHRLKVMADIEATANGQFHQGVGEQLQAVLALLDGGQLTQLEKLYLLDPLVRFSPLWQQVIGHFPHEIVESLPPQAPATTDLGRVQHLLQKLNRGECDKNADGQIIKSELEGDGTFRVVRSFSKTTSANFVAYDIKNSSADENSTLLVGSSGSEIDEALEIADLPRLGLNTPSPARPLLQLLPLALELLWSPLDPEKLLEFLLLPYSPLPQRVSRELAEVVAEQPGIGGLEWHSRIEKLRVREVEAGREEAWPELQSRITVWLECDRYPRSEGISAAVILDRVNAVADWLVQQGTLFADPHLAQLARIAGGQATELASLLVELDGQLLDVEILHYLLGQVTGEGTGLLDRGAECDPSSTRRLYGSREPANFRTALDHLYWWDPVPAKASSYPWSNSELAALRSSGVLLPDTSEHLKAQAESWLYPLYAARNSVSMILHPQESGHHPIWDQIGSVVEGWKEVNAETEILNGGEGQEPIKYTPLPQRQRWWHIEPEHLEKRERESYSSLDGFIKSPYQWVLNYKGKIRPGSLTTLNGGNRLKGTLVHHLYERFFNEHPDYLKKGSPEPDFVNQWLDSALPKLLGEEGATLLQPGYLVEKTRFEDHARTSLHSLLKQLQAADVIDVEMEGYHEGLSFAGLLGGYIDIRVTNREGQEALIDIKWGGEKYKHDDLVNNQHLQLVLYSYLRQKELITESWPTVAYFIIESGVLLAQNHNYFPDAAIASPKGDENIAEIWQRFATTWKWRREQIDKGIIEVTVSGTEGDENSQPGEDGMVLPESSDRYSDYGVLTGWSEEA